MYTRIFSCTNNIGINSKQIDIEIDMQTGYLPSFNIVGLTDKSVQESKERISSAISNSGYIFPRKRIIVNLAPADLNKKGSQFDLAIAIGILQADNQIPATKNKILFIGELSLDGSISGQTNLLSAIVLAKKKKFDKVVLPLSSRFKIFDEHELQKNLKDFIVNPIFFTSLIEVIFFLKEGKIPKLKHLNKKDISKLEISKGKMPSLFNQISGNIYSKKALEIAIAGRHNILFNGPPGSGKTMLSKAAIELLPKLTPEQILETTIIHQSHNNSSELITSPPFRSPHHTSTDITLTGGGRNPKVGEVSLAHNGVLFLDEFPEFSKRTIDALRQPIEDKKIKISRVNESVEYPSDFILIATMNPCKCGYYGHPKIPCKCSPGSVISYQQKISGPILDRIDLKCYVSEIDESEILKDSSVINDHNSLDKVKKRIENAILIQTERFLDLKSKNQFRCNSSMDKTLIIKHCVLNDNARNIMKHAYNKLNYTVRGYMKVLKVSRTIADLENSREIKEEHLLEAIQYSREKTNDII